MAKIKKLRQKTHDDIDKVMDKVENLRDIGNEKVIQIKEKTAMIKDDIDGYIKRNPEKSVLIAAGVGLVIGAMIAAAMMRRKDQKKETGLNVKQFGE